MRNPGSILGAPTRTDPSGVQRTYLRVVAIGDSVSHGVGDNVPTGSRGWARILTDAIGNDHDVSFCNVAAPGATAPEVRFKQLREALEHRPNVASLIVGINDTMRSTWDPAHLRSDILHCAQRLTDQGALLLTVRFHDHSQVLHLPSFLARPMRQRIADLNAIYDEVHERFGGLQVDLAAHPGIYDREFWSVDRLHPSELGHRTLAHEFAALLHEHGLSFEPPALELDGQVPSTLGNLRYLVAEATPWLVRRARDLLPAATRNLLRSRQT
jgi:lysophospholipase L1-like esterase